MVNSENVVKDPIYDFLYFTEKSCLFLDIFISWYFNRSISFESSEVMVSVGTQDRVRSGISLNRKVFGHETWGTLFLGLVLLCLAGWVSI